MGNKVAIGIPTVRGVRPKTVHSLIDMVAHSPYEFHTVVATEGYTTGENRTYIGVQAIRNECEWTLMVDDDMTFPKDTLTRLVELNKDIVGVNSYSRKLPLQSTVEYEGEIPDEPFKCKAVGGGVLLIRTQILKEMPRPWFNTEQNDMGMTTVGEDAWFCHKALDMGIDVWCEPRLPIGHLGEYNYKE